MFLNILKSFDYFGHPVVMHFGRNISREKQGEEKLNTVLGGIFSLCLRCIYIFLIYYYFSKMYNAEENSIAAVDINVNWEEFENKTDGI